MPLLSCRVAALSRRKPCGMRPPQDVIFDGTMMWAPFVEQTIAMVRDHGRVYRRGPGYAKVAGKDIERCVWLHGMARVAPPERNLRSDGVSRHLCLLCQSIGLTAVDCGPSGGATPCSLRFRGLSAGVGAAGLPAPCILRP